MIADRVGPCASGSAPELLEQARRLFVLHADADLTCREQRVGHESDGDYGIAIPKD